MVVFHNWLAEFLTVWQLVLPIWHKPASAPLHLPQTSKAGFWGMNMGIHGIHKSRAGLVQNQTSQSTHGCIAEGITWMHTHTRSAHTPSSFPNPLCTEKWEPFLLCPQGGQRPAQWAQSGTSKVLGNWCFWSLLLSGPQFPGRESHGINHHSLNHLPGTGLVSEDRGELATAWKPGNSGAPRNHLSEPRTGAEEGEVKGSLTPTLASSWVNHHTSPGFSSSF